MTDLEKFVDLYKSFGIECKVIVREEFDFNSAHGPHKAICLGGMGITKSGPNTSTTYSIGTLSWVITRFAR